MAPFEHAIEALEYARMREIIAAYAESPLGRGLAGGAALNVNIVSPGLSRDHGLFHDTDPALLATWDADRALLEKRGRCHHHRVACRGSQHLRGESRRCALHWIADHDSTGALRFHAGSIRGALARIVGGPHARAFPDARRWCVMGSRNRPVYTVTPDAIEELQELLMDASVSTARQGRALVSHECDFGDSAVATG